MIEWGGKPIISSLGGTSVSDNFHSATTNLLFLSSHESYGVRKTTGVEIEGKIVSRQEEGKRRC